MKREKIYFIDIEKVFYNFIKIKKIIMFKRDREKNKN
jgi:hypothetical protein